MSFDHSQNMSAWGPLIYAGCFAATLSSAIASLVGAPRVFQAVCKDKIYPGLFFFAKGFGANNDPVNGYCLVFVISVICIIVGNLNQVLFKFSQGWAMFAAQLSSQDVPCTNLLGAGLFSLSPSPH